MSALQRHAKALFLTGTIAAAVLIAVTGAQAAYPDRPVHLIVGYAPGGGSDIVTRTVGRALSERWKQPVLVENKPGADGSIAADYVAHAAPDGYTMIMVTNSHVMPALGYKLNYDPIKSFEPVSLADDKPMVLLVNPAVPAKSVQELVTLAKAKPGSLNYGTDGPATDPAMFTAMLMQKTGIKMTNVAYTGGGQSQVAVLSGEIQVVFGTLAAALGPIQSGQLRALAVTTDARSVALPDVPTLSESMPELKGFDEGAWNGILVPAGTPKDVIDKIHADMVEIMKAQDMKDNLAKMGIRPIASTPAEFRNFLVDESTKLTGLLKLLESSK